MLTYNNILDAFTIKLNKRFPNTDIFTTESIQGFTDSCFIVSLIPLSNITETKTTNKYNILVEIKYLARENQDKTSLYDILNNLQILFKRSLQVKNRYIKFDEANHDIYKDEVGYVLVYTIDITYLDSILTSDINEDIEEDSPVIDEGLDGNDTDNDGQQDIGFDLMREVDFKIK